MRDKYGVSQDSYCYKNSDVLFNKLNIENHESLAEAELAFTAIRFSEYSSKITSINKFNLNHLQTLNFHLFQDVYDWAGDIRTVDIAKGASRFCTCSRIDAEAHPFREGNGRTQRLFFEELCFFLGLNITWPDISKEEWIKANIDGYNGHLKSLEDIFTGAISDI